MQPDPKDVAKEVSRLVNCISDQGVEEFLEEMNRDHRTLQQGFTRLCVKWLEMQGSKEGHEYDLRNEASVQLGKKFLEKLDDGERHLPFI